MGIAPTNYEKYEPIVSLIFILYFRILNVRYQHIITIASVND